MTKKERIATLEAHIVQLAISVDRLRGFVEELQRAVLTQPASPPPRVTQNDSKGWDVT